MNDQTIQLIAQAIIANTKVIQSLIDTLPHEYKVSVAEVVTPAAPAPVAPAPAPMMPPPPTFQPAPAPAAPTGVPFSDSKGLIAYVMDSYNVMGPQKGAGIQNVLTSLGYQNINDIKPEHYSALFSGIEALKGV